MPNRNKFYFLSPEERGLLEDFETSHTAYLGQMAQEGIIPPGAVLIHEYPTVSILPAQTESFRFKKQHPPKISSTKFDHSKIIYRRKNQDPVGSTFCVALSTSFMLGQSLPQTTEINGQPQRLTQSFVSTLYLKAGGIIVDLTHHQEVSLSALNPLNEHDGAEMPIEISIPSYFEV